MDSQAAASPISILTVLLSSSVVLGTITGAFYFAGGAYTEGYRHALGLNFLAGLQPAEYIFSGAEILLLSSYALVSFLGSWIAVAGGEMLPVKLKRVPRSLESFVVVLVITTSSILLLGFTLESINASRNLISSGACPVTGHGSEMRAFSLFCVAVIVAGLGRFFLEPRLLRLTFLIWGIVACALSLYGFGWAFGAAKLYDKFQIVEIGSTSLQLPFPARLLVLGADDKNLVVLTPGGNRTGHAEPKYLLRSEIKAFSVVGTASINDFVCSPARQPLSRAER